MGCDFFMWDMSVHNRCALVSHISFSLTHTHTYTHTHIHTYTHTHIHTYTHTHVHTYTHIHILTCTHTHTHITYRALKGARGGEWMCVRVNECVWEWMSVCESEWVCERQRQWESASASKCVCVCEWVCVCERESKHSLLVEFLINPWNDEELCGSTSKMFYSKHNLLVE